VVGEILCSGRVETLDDAEKAVRWWRDNVVRYGSGLRGCGVVRCRLSVLIAVVLTVCMIME
jgi:hypothetical protein